MLNNKQNETSIVVAIDGPSASGKSTVSKLAARRMGFLYVDSGAMYRGVTWKALQSGVSVKDPARVIPMMQEARWEFMVEQGAVVFTIDGVNPGQELRSEPVRENVADIAAIPEVRAFIVDRLREMRRFGHIVMEGRDIGSVVFPESPFKFYLDADAEERARRRHREIVAMEGGGTEQDVLKSLKRRDHKDQTRNTAPLQIPLGAIVINSTNMDADGVVSAVVDVLRQAGVKA